MQRTVTSLLTANKEVESITVCGHSLGGALASMSAFDLAISELNKVMLNVSSFRFGICLHSPFLMPGVRADIASCSLSWQYANRGIHQE